jgi:hypothetical protein
MLYGYGRRGKLSFSVGKYTTVFQAEMYATKAGAAENIDRGTKTEIFVL